MKSVRHPVGLHPSLQRRRLCKSALTKKLLARIVESGWTGADVNGLGRQTELYVEQLVWAAIRTGGLGGQQSGRRVEREKVWTDKIGVVLCNSSSGVAGTDDSASHFIFYIYNFSNLGFYVDF